MSRAEMEALGWDQCDIILVTGDAYIDHPSFGMALVGRLLEAQGFRVGIISQPDWHSAEPSARSAAGAVLRHHRRQHGFDGQPLHGRPQDPLRRRLHAQRRANKRPDRAVVVYAQRCREAFPDVPVVIGSIEASLRRIAHYDYWSDKVRRSVLPDSKADLLLFGNAERALVELAHRLAKGEPIEAIRDLRGTAFMVPRGWRRDRNGTRSTRPTLDTPGAVHAHPDPYAMEERPLSAAIQRALRAPSPASRQRRRQAIRIVPRPSASPRARTAAPTPSSACRPTSR
jgi:radical SAM superfamily enzyme YgiQ (UPF0313 family)